MERKPFVGGSRSERPSNRNGSFPRVAREIDNVKEGLLTPRDLKNLSKKQVKTAVALGKLSLSVLNEDILEITPSEIIDDISEGTLPQEALRVLSLKELKDAMEKGKVILQVRKREINNIVDKNIHLSQICSSKFPIESAQNTESCCSISGIGEIEEIKKAVAEGAMSPLALWQRAGMLPLDIITDVRHGILPESVLIALHPVDLIEAIEEGILELSSLKGIDMGLITEAFADEKIPYCGVKSSLSSHFETSLFEYVKSSRDISEEIHGGPLSFEEALDILPQSAIHEQEPQRNEGTFKERSMVPSRRAAETEHKRDRDFIRELHSFSDSKTPSSVNNETGNNLNPPDEDFSRQLQDALDRGYVTLQVTQRAQTDDDVGFIKKAVFNGYLPPSALKEQAGLSARDIATSVMVKNLPFSALEALTLEEIRELIDNGELPSYVLPKLNRSRNT